MEVRSDLSHDERHGGTTHVVAILDRSGSMGIGGKARAAEEAWRGLVMEQERYPGRILYSVVQFDTEYEVVHKGVGPEAAKDVVVMPRGATALLDAIGKTLSDLRGDPKGDKVVVAVMTDGEENSSREYNYDTCFRAVEEAQGRGWQVLFMGCNQNAIKEASKMGFTVGQTMTYAPSAVGTQATVNSLSNNLAGYRSGTRATMDWSESDRQTQTALGVPEEHNKEQE